MTPPREPALSDTLPDGFESSHTRPVTESENPGADPFDARIARLPLPARLPRPISDKPRGRVEERVDALEHGMKAVLEELEAGRSRDELMADAVKELHTKTDVFSKIYGQLKRPIWLAVGAGVAALLRAIVAAWGDDGAVTAAERRQIAQDVAAAVAESLQKDDSGK